MDRMSTDLLKKVREDDPEKIDEILRDKAMIMKAVKDRNVELLNQIKDKYADYSN
jgi:hypothetical protein